MLLSYRLLRHVPPPAPSPRSQPAQRRALTVTFTRYPLLALPRLRLSKCRYVIHVLQSTYSVKSCFLQTLHMSILHLFLSFPALPASNSIMTSSLHEHQHPSSSSVPQRSHSNQHVQRVHDAGTSTSAPPRPDKPQHLQPATTASSASSSRPVASERELRAKFAKEFLKLGDSGYHDALLNRSTHSVNSGRHLSAQSRDQPPCGPQVPSCDQNTNSNNNNSSDSQLEQTVSDSCCDNSRVDHLSPSGGDLQQVTSKLPRRDTADVTTAAAQDQQAALLLPQRQLPQTAHDS